MNEPTLNPSDMRGRMAMVAADTLKMCEDGHMWSAPAADGAQECLWCHRVKMSQPLPPAPQDAGKGGL